MENSNILMLVCAQHGTQDGWQARAQDLAVRAKVKVVLPLRQAAVNQGMGSISGLPMEGQASKKKVHYPFASLPAPAAVPLYGTPVYSGQATASDRRTLPGEAEQVGHLTSPGELENKPQPAKQDAPADLQASIIRYAREASQQALRQPFDTIYAFDWQTYLAALELKLVTGKKLVLQVDPATLATPFPGQQGWMQDIVRQAFEKADVIQVQNEQVAAYITRAYGFAVPKIKLPGKRKSKPVTPFRGLYPKQGPMLRHMAMNHKLQVA
jgi:hypothetical protein